METLAVAVSGTANVAMAMAKAVLPPVIAEVRNFVNGEAPRSIYGAFYVLKTPEGLQVCRPVAHDKPEHYRPISSLRSFVTQISEGVPSLNGRFQIDAASDPNNGDIKLKEHFPSLWHFRASGLDFICTGTEFVTVR